MAQGFETFSTSILACVLLTLGIVQIKVDVFIPENEEVYQFLSVEREWLKNNQCNGDILVHSQCRFTKRNAKIMNYKIHLLDAEADLSQSIKDLFLPGEFLEQCDRNMSIL